MSWRSNPSVTAATDMAIIIRRTVNHARMGVESMAVRTDLDPFPGFPLTALERKSRFRRFHSWHTDPPAHIHERIEVSARA
jgi:hypothetical protein